MFGDPVKNHNEWKAVKLQEVAQIVSGVTKGRKLSGKEVISAPYLRVANVQDGYLELDEIKLIEVLPSDVEKFALKEGDVLLTEGGDPDKLGRGSVWHDEIPNCIHQNHIFRVRVNKKHLIPEFLSMLIGSPYGKMYFLKSAKQTTGIASINSKQLKNFPALIPPLELQNKLTEIIRQTEQIQKHQTQSNQQIDDLFNALMQQAFRGELTT
jgi:type I restriction enzyme S subunit